MKEITIQEAMVDNFMPYSAYLILHRALPMIDGFKPSQRRVLYTMYKNNNIYNKPYVKSNSTVGDVMKIHPHGSSYETLVRMTEGHEAFGVPFIDSKGNFGKLYSRDSREAADRYTDARLNKIASELFVGISKDAVPMIDTYDEQGKEPVVLPVPYPTILTNGVSGMAVGMATDIPPFNFHEVIKYTISILKNEESDILKYIPSPDFPTVNHIVYDENEMKSIMESGRGSFKIRANYEIEGNAITFTHIPYTTRYEVVIEQIVDLVKEGKLKEVTDVHDLYGMNTTGIQIEAKKGTHMGNLVEKLFSLTKLEDSYSVNLNLVINNKPQVMGVTQVVEEWIKFRKETISNISKFQLSENNIQLEKLQGLDNIKNVLDEVVQLIRSTDSKDISDSLRKEFNLTKIQSDYIEGIQLKNLAKDYILKRLEEIKKLEENNQTLNQLINNDDFLNDFIIQQLEKLNKEYSYPRQTKLVNKMAVMKDRLAIDNKELEIEDYNLKLFITKDLYLKKLPLTSMRGKFTNRLKEDDSFVIEEELTNTGEVIVFTNKRNVYKKRLHEIEDAKPSELGEYIPSMFDYEKDEKSLFVLPLRKEFDQCIVLGFDDGTIAKIDSKAYHTKQNRQLLKNGYADKELIYVGLNSEDKLKAITSDGYAVVRDLSKFSPKASRSANGNRFMSINNGEKVVEYVIANEEDIDKYEIMSAGKGKRVK